MHRDPDAFVNAQPMEVREQDRSDAESYRDGGARKKRAPTLADIETGGEMPNVLIDEVE